MRILLVNGNCLVGGVETFMLTWAKALQARGYSCELFFFEHGPMENQIPPSIRTHFGDLVDCLRLVRDQKIDVVHGSSVDWNLGISALRYVGAKLVITIHNGFIFPAWNSTNCDALVACSRWLTRTQQRFTDLPVQTIPYSIDTGLFHPDEGTKQTSSPIVAWVGRASDLQAKRIDRFAAVAPFLHRAGVRLWIADPDGPEKVAEVAPQVVETLLPLADFWGAVPRDQMPNFFRQVAASGGCCLCTSDREGLPLTLIEAQACSCPVIGSNIPGVDELVHEQHGGVLYSPDSDSGELASLIVSVLTDKAGMAWRRQACARYARENFSLERMAQQYLKVYEEAPYPRRKTFAAVRARLRISPLNFGFYAAHRWLAGRVLYETSRNLARQRSWDLAAAVMRASLRACPTIYIRPKRVYHLVETFIPMLRVRSTHL